MEHTDRKRDSSIEAILDQLMQDLQEKQIPIHALLAAKDGEPIYGTYRPPFDAGRPHRMFSITKSITSLAIGFLIAEGRLSLQDPVCAYFPEYVSEQTHPWIRSMTIRDMLTMQTCHSSTTYKFHSDQNWVESFFVVPPTNRSGQIFQYDTSSAHTLAALVRKMTGKNVLSYLREVCPEGFALPKEAHILCDPFGAEIGGSGLVCLPSDLMKIGLWIRGVLRGFSGSSDAKSIHSIRDYLQQAVRFEVPTAHFGQTLEEQQGYGYQFWKIRGGFAMYGMGGQYLLFYPSVDLILVTCSDTQNLKGGTQILLNSIYDHIKALPGFTDTVFVPGAVMDSTGQLCFAPACMDFDRNYRFSGSPLQADPMLSEKAPIPFDRIRLAFSKSDADSLTKTDHPDHHFDDIQGALVITLKNGTEMKIPFCTIQALKGQITEPESGTPLEVWTRARFVRPDELFLPVQILSDEMGSLILDLRFGEDAVTVYVRSILEGMFRGWTGIFEGIRI